MCFYDKDLTNAKLHAGQNPGDIALYCALEAPDDPNKPGKCARAYSGHDEKCVDSIFSYPQCYYGQCGFNRVCRSHGYFWCVDAADGCMCSDNVHAKAAHVPGIIPKPLNSCRVENAKYEQCAKDKCGIDYLSTFYTLIEETCFAQNCASPYLEYLRCEEEYYKSIHSEYEMGKLPDWLTTPPAPSPTPGQDVNDGRQLFPNFKMWTMVFMLQFAIVCSLF